MSLKTFFKDPDAEKDYTIDWSAWLNGDRIATSAWDVPAGITSNANTKTSATTTIWLNGGSAGTTYSVRNRITTAGGRTEDRTINITIEAQ